MDLKAWRAWMHLLKVFLWTVENDGDFCWLWREFGEILIFLLMCLTLYSRFGTCPGLELERLLGTWVSL